MHSSIHSSPKQQFSAFKFLTTHITCRSKFFFILLAIYIIFHTRRVQKISEKNDLS